MSYSVVRKPRIIQARSQPTRTGAILGEGDQDESGAKGKDGQGGQRVPAEGVGRGPGVGKGANTGKSTTTSAAGKGTGESKAKGTAGVGKLLRRPAATHQNSTQKTTHSYGAYSITVPDQKKWSDLQKTGAELAALEKLKCRNIGHVSITPSTVGGTLTQEEVRRRQQQDFSKAKMAQVSDPTSIQHLCAMGGLNNQVYL
ncbi:uncharacterized protein [Scyliorhinus torazame]|uniref:uncharacterized protein isoform X2 n=1 Tax=Scyliorhinus torazame TaxID=75743 RepID=UPI003B5B7C83